jgi:hypothetical protein
MSNPFTDVVMTAEALRLAAPNSFKTFCDSLIALEKKIIADVMAADSPTDVFRAQGRAQLIKELIKHIAGSQELHDTYVRRDNHARSGFAQP